MEPVFLGFFLEIGKFLFFATYPRELEASEFEVLGYSKEREELEKYLFAYI